MGELILVVIALLLGGVMGWVAFFRTLSLSSEVKSLRTEIEQLTSGSVVTAPSTATPASQSSPDAESQPSEPEIEERAEATTPEPIIDNPSASEPAVRGPEKVEVERPWRDAIAAREITEDNTEKLNQFSGAAAPSSDRGLEERLAGNWLIWLGGATLMLGGAFLLKSAIDAGFFGPGMRIFSALCAGAAMIGASEWLRRTEPDANNETTDESSAQQALNQLQGNSLAPPVLAAAGGATLYGAIFAAYGLYSMLPSLVALVLLAAACGGMVVLAALHRAPLVAGLGLAGAYISPILTASGEPSPDALMLYVYGVSAAGLIVARIMSWRSISYAALVGGMLWPFLLIAAPSGDIPLSLYIYPPAYLLLAAFVAWDEVDAPVDMSVLINKGLTGLSVSLAAFYIATVSVIALAFLVTLKFEAAPQAVLMWGAISILTLVGARRREAFSLSPHAVFFAVLLLTAFTDFGEWFSQTMTALGFAALFGGGGLALMMVRVEKGPAASLVAFAPIAFLAALFHQAGQPSGAILWSIAALGLVCASVLVLSALMRRSGGPDAHPGASSVLVLGAALASTLSVAMYADGFMMSVGIALQAPLLVWLWRRFDLPALKYAAGILAGIATVRLFWLPEVLGDDFGVLPILNWLLVAYLAPAVGFWVSAMWLRGGGLEKNSRILQGLEGGAIALFAAFVTLQIRHLMNDGAIDRFEYSLLEVSLQTINWVSIAAFLRWRFGNELTLIRRASELVLIGLAAVHMLLFNLSGLNPWWGGGPQVHGPLIFNMLAVAYLMPAAAFAGLAYATQRSNALLQARAAGLFAALLSYVWLILSIRHSFHAPNLSLGGVSDAEAWAYSTATILYGTLLLVVSAFRRSAMLCLTGLGAQGLAVCIALIFGIAGLMEASLQAVNWILIAIFFHWRFGDGLTAVFRFAKFGLISLAVAYIWIFNLLALSPWWSDGPQVHGTPVFNLLAVAYLMPAAAFAALAFMARRSSVLAEARAAGLFAAFLLYVWLVLSIRHAFHAPILSGGNVGDAESWAYSIGTILYGTLLLIAGAFRRSAVLRFAGLGALMLAVCKVFLFDMAGLDGVWRASSFLGLGAALVGIAVLYQRLLAPMLAKDERKNAAGT